MTSSMATLSDPLSGWSTSSMGSTGGARQRSDPSQRRHADYSSLFRKVVEDSGEGVVSSPSQAQRLKPLSTPRGRQGLQGSVKVEVAPVVELPEDAVEAFFSRERELEDRARLRALSDAAAATGDGDERRRVDRDRFA